jgi:hypothetical protein
LSGQNQKQEIDDRLMLWWWWSVPYSLAFLTSVGALELFGVSGWSLGHTGIFLPFLAFALVTSLSSGIWFLVAVYKVFVSCAIRLSIRNSLLLLLSAVAGAWSALYLARS